MAIGKYIKINQKDKISVENPFNEYFGKSEK
jgi:hypothetical protein